MMEARCIRVVNMKAAVSVGVCLLLQGHVDHILPDLLLQEAILQEKAGVAAKLKVMLLSRKYIRTSI
jgi:hypothetical protein